MGGKDLVDLAFVGLSSYLKEKMEGHEFLDVNQVVVDFIVDHLVVDDSEVGLIEIHLWSLYFDGSVSSKGQGIGCFIMSPSGTCFELAARLEFPSTNN
jgi:hypothetical protein